MSKILTKTVKKAKFVTILSSAILAVILLAAVAVGTLCGLKGWGVFNGSASVSDTKTVTVSVSQYLYQTEMDAIEDECDKAFKSVNVVQTIKGEMSGDVSEIVYVFDADENIDAATKALKESFAALTGADGAWNGWDVKVSVNEAKATGTVAKNYVLRGCIAGAVIAVIALAYVAVRYKWRMGIVAGVCVLLAMATTAALLIVTRILVTPAVAYVIAASALLTALTVMLNLSKLRNNLKSESAIDKSAEELVSESVAEKEILLVTIFLGVALLLTGILGGTSLAWFCLAAIVGLIVAVFMGLVYSPALMLPMQKATAKRAAMNADYKGAKKTSFKVKKLFAKKEAPVEEKAEEPVSEVAEEAVEEETPVEETEEEVAEAPAEEEAPAETEAEEASEEEKED